MDISIVIPAYNESKKIARDIEAATAFLENQHFTGQVIVVDDGSKDNTAEVAKNAFTNPPTGIEIKVERYNHHRGKGYAVRKGIEQTSGEYVMFADSGLCVPYADTLRGLDLIKYKACDIAHGSRKMKECNIFTVISVPRCFIGL
ncbi:MAG: glycosyltransferase [Planctomycetota bacterium]|jgi:cellulose synthase/poly-beta-1,6-N-acetylglucosamine synthase-like glycosyltransferase